MSATCVQMVPNFLPWQIHQNVKLVNLCERVWGFIVLIFFNFIVHLKIFEVKVEGKITTYDTARGKYFEKFVGVRKSAHILLPCINI